MEPENAVQAALDAGAQLADVRVETVTERRVDYQDRQLEGLVQGAETGFALRVLVDGAWGFASSNDLSGAAWRGAVDRAVALAKTARDPDHLVELADTPQTKAVEHWRPRKDPADVSIEEALELLQDLDKAVRVHDEVRSVSTAYSDTHLSKHYVDSAGSDIQWSLVRTVAQLHFTARKGEAMAAQAARVGGTMGWELFSEQDPIAKAEKAAATAVKMLDAPPAKGGRTTVVIDHELAGVFAHEAVGHASEADLVAAGESCFRDRMGERLGIEGLTIRDDPTQRGSFGAYPFDDDGVATRDRLILDDGVLAGYLCDRQFAARFGMQANGAARAQSYQHRPLVRMGTTLIDAGEHPEEEVLDVKDGIYCRGSRGGQVDTARGTFLFNAAEAYRIENGEITTPIRDVSLTGDILSTLHNIDALGNKQRLGDPGYCGKGQWIPVCDGGPLVRIQDCLVGGAS